MMWIASLVLKELRLHWASSLLVIAGVAVAVALCLGLPAFYDSAGRETRRLQRDLGFNLRIIPAGTDKDRFYARGYSEKTMAETVVERLATQDTVAYNHLVATLQRTIELAEKPAVLVGLAPTVFPPGHEKPPMSPEIATGEAHVGFQIAQRLGLSKGDPLSIASRDFRVARVAPPSGNVDDIRVWVSLAEAQAALKLPGRINEIKAIDCLCLSPDQDPLGKLQEVISSLAPEAEVAMLSRMAATRAGQRRMIEQFAEFAVPAAVFAGSAWVCLLSIANVRQRRQELGLLRAIGHGPGRIGALFLGKAL
ncbi:MAG: hypothetical protein AAF961_09070, partial [Planctomycetota bacterium]